MSVRTRIVAIALTGLFLFAAPSVARAQIEKGDQSIQFQGQYLQIVSPQSEDPQGIVLGSYNYYFTSKVGLKSTAGVILGAETGYIAGAGIEFNFSSPGQTTIPYVKLDLLGIKFSSANLLMISPGAGIRFFMNRNTSFDVAASYNHAVASFEGGSGDGAAVQVLLGFSYFFGGGSKR